MSDLAFDFEEKKLIANAKRNEKIQQTFKSECKVVLYVEVISLANYLQIAGPFDNIVEKMRGVFNQKLDSFDCTHIYRALPFHDGHEFQNVVADVVATHCLSHLFFGGKLDSKKEMDAY